MKIHGLKLYRTIAYFLILLSFTAIVAQDATCGATVQQALDAVGQTCEATGRNQACYGYVSLQATPREGVQNFNFTKQGDLVSVADIDTLRLSSFDPVAKTWGIALMKLQASLPDSLPGQNVAFLIFGNVQITNASTPDAGTPTGGNSTPEQTPYTPMQAFYFSTAITQTGCEEAPQDGILIQTPKGVGKINMRANDVDIQLGSTAYLQAQASGNMTVSVVEGEGHITAQGVSIDVPAGTFTTIPIDANLRASGTPTPAQPYDPALVAPLPIRVLPDPITIAPPLIATAEATETSTTTTGSLGPFEAQTIMNLGGATVSGSVCSITQAFEVNVALRGTSFVMNFTPSDATTGTYSYHYSFPSAGERDTGSGSYTISEAAGDGSRTLTIDGQQVAEVSGGSVSVAMHYSLGLTPSAGC